MTTIAEAQHPELRRWIGEVTMRVAGTGQMPVREFVTVVQDELPANARFEIWVGDARVWPTAPAELEGAAS